MPHGLLIQGRRGIGKLMFARHLTQSLLCEMPSGPERNPCGACPACVWFEGGNHPDFRLLEPESISSGGSGELDEKADVKGRDTDKKGSPFITIHQVRALTDFVGLSTHRDGARVILIHPAEALNAHSANALLKTLEEPPPRTVFLLVSHQPQRLLPTIRSRCQVLEMPMPDRQTAVDWLSDKGVEQAELCLAQAGGAPLAALEMGGRDYQTQRRAFLLQLGEDEGRDPLLLAEAAQRQDLSDTVSWLQSWVFDLVAVRLAGVVRYNPDFSTGLRALAKRANLLALLAYERRLGEARRSIHHPLNPQLLLEDLFLSYWRIFGGPGSARP